MNSQNTNPYDSQDYNAQALPYIPYAVSDENASSSYNEQPNIPSNEVYVPTPSDYENTPPYTQVAAVSPNTDTLAPSNTTLTAPPRKKQRLWLWLSIAALFVLVAGVSSFMLLSYLNRSTPARTLDTFCTALQQGKYQTAYDQFTPSMQTNFTEPQFATLLSSDSVAVCSHGAVSENGTSTTTDLHLYHSKSKGINNDRVVVIKDSHNQWKINDIQKVS